MQVLIKLYDMVHPAADGSVISREVTEAYLASEDYKIIINDKLALGGKTHKDRRIESSYQDLIGPDDEVLVRNNALFYISKIFTKPDSDFCWAVIDFFDPDNFSGQLHDEMVNIQGILKAGTKLPCSVVIDAYWAPDNKCEEIIRIKGVDFTLNPSFIGSGTEKLMSVTTLEEGNVTKVFSALSAVKKVKQFSLVTDVAEPIYKENEVEGNLIDKISNTIDSTVIKEILSEICEKVINDSSLRKQVSDEIGNYLAAPESRHFSINSIVEDKLQLYKMAPPIAMRYLANIYGNYFATRSKSITKGDFLVLRGLFISDVLSLIKNSISSIKEGSNISSIFQLASLDPDVSQAGRDLTIIYRRVLFAEDTVGYIPKGTYMKWTEALRNFFSVFTKEVFGESAVNASEPLTNLVI